MAAARIETLPSPCAPHGAPAGWICTSCNQALCPKCAHHVRAGFGHMVVCNACGGYGSPITVPRRFRRLSAFLEDTVKFPMRDQGWVVVVLFGLILAGLKSIPIAGEAVAAYWVAVYLYFTASRSADGLDDLPPVADFSRIRDANRALWSAFCAVVFAVAPACYYILKRAGRLPWTLVANNGHAIALTPGTGFWTTPLFKIDGFVFDPILVLLTLPLLLWLPGILLFSITGLSLTDIVNPETSVRGYARLGRASLLLLLGLSFIAAVDVFANLIDFNWVRFDFVANPLAEMVKLYAVLIAARLYGLVLYVRGYVVDYGRPEDYLEPALGSAEPTASAPAEDDETDRPVEPIDLPPADGRTMEQLLTAAADPDAMDKDDAARLRKLRRERAAIDLPPAREGEEMQIEHMGLVKKVPTGSGR